MAFRTTLKKFSGKWDVKLKDIIVGSAMVKKSAVDIKTNRGTQSFFLELNPDDAKSMIMTNNAMKQKNAFWNAKFVKATELKWTMDANKYVSVSAPLYWVRDE
jgi:TATA-binding protein-associated factor Taf7